MDADRALNRLAKWRQVFAGWQLGTRLKGDPESDAVRDHREVTLLMRAELSALVNLLVEHKVFTGAEFTDQLTVEALALSEAYERKFPGMRATDDGITYEMPAVGETMKGWRP